MKPRLFLFITPLANFLNNALATRFIFGIPHSISSYNPNNRPSTPINADIEPIVNQIHQRKVPRQTDLKGNFPGIYLP
jgi:hypothetical protein